MSTDLFNSINLYYNIQLFVAYKVEAIVENSKFALMIINKVDDQYNNESPNCRPKRYPIYVIQFDKDFNKTNSVASRIIYNILFIFDLPDTLLVKIMAQ